MQDTNIYKTVTLPAVTSTELAVLILGVEDRISDLQLRLNVGAEFNDPQDAMDHRRRHLVAAWSVLAKLRAGNP
jgi:hypothetical protein